MSSSTRNLYSDENENKILNLVTDKGFQAIVEKDIGKPIECRINWDQGEIYFHGPKLSKVLCIQKTLEILTRNLH